MKFDLELVINMAHVRVIKSTVVCPMPLMLHLLNLEECVRGGGETLLTLNLMLCLFNGCNVLRRQQDQLRIRVLNGKVKECGHADLQPADEALNGKVTYDMILSKASPLLCCNCRGLAVGNQQSMQTLAHRACVSLNITEADRADQRLTSTVNWQAVECEQLNLCNLQGLMVSEAHPTDDGVHEDVKLIHAVEWRRNDTRQSKHEADGDEAALSSRQRLHVFGRLASDQNFEFHKLLRVVQLDAPLELLPMQVPAATHA